ncbi:hypothetical protein [Hymenobacter sp. DG25B]|uniref:hypothetical protein n=1 Tax=Hymenobacter sp. DG25B TaxID=1385664 RepID=UPI0012E00DC9|nr:hypothetical protein [Hymenobacter sp. DG25B]
MNCLLTFLILLISIINTSIQTNGEIIEEKKFSGVIFPAGFKISELSKTERWTPSKREIEIAEEDLTLFMITQGHFNLSNQGNGCPIIYKNLKNYIRQYAGYISPKGHKMIYINCFWHKSNIKNWKTNFVLVFDGCSNYWQIQYDVDDQKFIGFLVNGRA